MHVRHVHMLETKTRLAIGDEMYGQNPLAYLHGIGALSRSTTFAHGIWLTDADMKMVADA